VRVVAKIGTASITDERGVIDAGAVAKLCDEVAALRAQGHEVIVVSSGAVAAGVAALAIVEPVAVIVAAGHLLRAWAAPAATAPALVVPDQLRVP